MSAPIHALCLRCEGIVLGAQDSTGHVYPEAHQCQEEK